MAEFWITERWLREHSTGNAGWTAAQLRVLDVAWPPKRGWLKQQVGRLISTEQRDAFEQVGAESRGRQRRA